MSADPLTLEISLDLSKDEGGVVDLGMDDFVDLIAILDDSNYGDHRQGFRTTTLYLPVLHWKALGSPSRVKVRMEADV